MRASIALALCLGATGMAQETAQAASATPAAVEKVFAAYRDALPTKKDLAIYTLDWAADLAEAKARAKREKRPIFFIWLTNHSGPASFLTGHC